MEEARRPELASRLRSAISPIYDARQPLDRIRDHIASAPTSTLRPKSCKDFRG